MNKPYSEADYKTLKQKIITQMQTTGEYGEFFPITMSPFAYNESAAQEFVELTPDQVHTAGWRWKTDLPQIKGKAGLLQCTKCGSNFKIQKAEESFYQKMHLPHPLLCINCRYRVRLRRLNPKQLWHRRCMCTQTDHTHSGQCPTQFQTTYSPNRLEVVYCETCYQKEVY